MDVLLEDLFVRYNDLMTNHKDSRVDGWLLMSSPFPTAVLCLLYVYIVLRLGPSVMKNREPFQFRRLLVIYNGCQVIFSAWIFYKVGSAGWFGHYSFQCQPVDYSQDPRAVAMVHVSWWYFISKFTEFFDTFFFILRKKPEQVSTLHVIHHGIMPISVWFGVKFTPGGHSTFFGFLNTFVHIVMYFYYMIAAMGPQYNKFLWWKRHLTNLQMVQFVLIFLHSFQLLWVDCKYPAPFMWWIGGHAVLFFLLFSDYYYKAYLNGKRRKLSKNVKENPYVKNGMLLKQSRNHKVSRYLHGLKKSSHKGSYLSTTLLTLVEWAFNINQLLDFRNYQPDT